jgi:3-methyladenine DNA glycosylase/8-oxoguanine DNA glycosylase
VCSYGFFTTAPNQWVQATGSSPAAFKRPLRLSASKQLAHITITQTQRERLSIETASAARLDDYSQKEVLRQVGRMLRLLDKDTADVAAFHKLQPTAAIEGFGRLFRSPTMWEDMVKSILLCNCGWGRTLTMNKALCTEVGTEGAFPTPQQVVAAGVDTLQQQCGLGYRSKTVYKLALQIESGEANLTALEAQAADPSVTSDQLIKLICKLPGMGPYSAANMLQLLGRYDRVACDTETLRHVQQHKLNASSLKTMWSDVEQVYKSYAPYQFLAYWYEIWRDYESYVGPFHLLHPSQYHLLTGNNMRKSKALQSATITSCDSHTGSCAALTTGKDTDAQPAVATALASATTVTAGGVVQDGCVTLGPMAPVLSAYVAAQGASEGVAPVSTPDVTEEKRLRGRKRSRRNDQATPVVRLRRACRASW